MAQFYCFDGVQWWQTPVPAAAVEQCSPEDLLAKMVSSAPADFAYPTAESVAADEPVLPTVELRPAWSFAGEMVDGVLLTGNVAGETVGLTALDIRVLHSLPVVPVDEPSRKSLSALLEWGLAREVQEDEPEPTGATVSTRAASANGAAHEAAPAPAFQPDDRPDPTTAAIIGTSRRVHLSRKVSDAYRSSSKLGPLRRLLGSDDAPPPAPEPTVATLPTLPVLPTIPAPTDSDVVDESGEAVEADLSHPPADEDEDEVAADATTASDHRIPVYSIWHPAVGPLLSLGMLAAAAKHFDGGSLTETFDFRPIETADEFLEHLGSHDGPAILLCSNYVWSLEENLAAARSGRALNDDLLVLHGGPSCPKYEGDAEVFLDNYADIAHVLVRGEGERTLCEVLRALVGNDLRIDAATFGTIDGITFRDPVTGETVRTPDRERISHLDELPSPYLTGEFDHIPAEAWNNCLSIETNRGCPYGCTFCDWGSSTLSRIRKFDADRVAAEIDWAAAHGVISVMITDANFGIMSRDVDIARHLAASRRSTGFPEWVALTPAKNTTKHLVEIMDTLLDASIVPTLSLSLQTIDDTVLDAIDRSNITVDHYVRLAAEYRRRGLPLQGDLLIGMAAQTYESYQRDLQFNLDHEILVRTWPVQVLPNAPMNAPEYRSAHAIEVDDQMTVVATSTFTRADRERMYLLRRVYVAFEVFGLLRHVTRALQWEHGVVATDLMERMLQVVESEPDRYPQLSWIVSYFDLFPTAPGSWSGFYDDVRRVVTDELGIEIDEGLEMVFELQEALMPVPGRRFPHSMDLPHDYVAYFRDATASLFETGKATGPTAPLTSYPPATFEVTGDPLQLCTYGPRLSGDSRDKVLQGDYYMASTSAYELESPLVRVLPHVVRMFDQEYLDSVLDEATAGLELGPLTPDDPERRVRINLTSSAT